MELLWILLILIVFLWNLCRCSPTLKFYIKYTLLCFNYIFLAACSGLFSLFNPGSSKNLYIAQFISRVIGIRWLFGFDVVLEDWERLMNVEKPIVIVSNHQSMIDALIMLQTSPNGTAPLAKRSLLYVPIFGIVSWLYGTIFINRSKGSSAIQMMHNVGLQMKEKCTSVWIFAEGTRHQNDKVGAFKKGAFHLAIQAQVPIVPVVIGNYRNVIDCNNCLFDGGVIRAKALQPITTDGMESEDVDELMTKVHRIISNSFDEDYEKHAELYKDLIPPKDN